MVEALPAAPDLNLGIDVGTSSLKLAVTGYNGELLSHAQLDCPLDYTSTRQDIGSILRDILSKILPRQPSYAAITVSSVAPALACIHLSNGSAHLIFSHLTPTRASVAGHSYHSGDIQDRLTARWTRTVQRLLENEPALCESSDACLAPLSSAITYLLTGNYVRDAVSAYELGVSDWTSSTTARAIFNGTGLKVQCGIPSSRSLSDDPPITAKQRIATTDTVASAFGAGVGHRAYNFLYLGSYFSAAEFHIDPRSLAQAERIERPPYTWRISMPRYGVMLDRMLEVLRVGQGVENRFGAFDQHFEGSGRIFSDSMPVVRTTTEAVGGDTKPTLSITLTENLTLSGILQGLVNPLTVALGRLSEGHSTWHVAGGFARWANLLGHIATNAGVSIIRQAGGHTAVGAARLAVPGKTAEISDYVVYRP